jgi:hypothetical protein
MQQQEADDLMEECLNDFLVLPADRTLVCVGQDDTQTPFFLAQSVCGTNSLEEVKVLNGVDLEHALGRKSKDPHIVLLESMSAAERKKLTSRDRRIWKERNTLRQQAKKVVVMVFHDPTSRPRS